ncbi:MAG TPA: hypothetical protein DEA63_00210 [Firmicutes bacterium]|nr:hypothetical protein [Bacillota bacterium]
MGVLFCAIIQEMAIPYFLEFAELYRQNGFPLYAVGGTCRDFLLGKEPNDFDFVTSATPDQEKAFLPQADYSFARFGSIKLKRDGQEIDITTFRKEGGYKDFRHPSFIRFVLSPKIDSERRDFTINALYLDPDGKVLDFHGGMADLKNKIIRFIGDPETRIQEDPLRILRAERFAARLGFSFSPETGEAIERLRPLLDKLNPEKVKEEMKKR